MKRSKSSKSKAISLNKKPHNFYWTKVRCSKEAKKYKIISHFKSNSYSAYRSAKNNGWLLEICSHMISPQKPKGYWTWETCEEAAKKAVTLANFQKISGAYAKALNEGWIDSLGLIRKQHSKGHWTTHAIKKLMANCKTQAEFIKNHNNAYQAAIKQKIWGSLKTLLIPTKNSWDRQKTFEKALEFPTKVAFRSNAPGAYGYARKHGFLEEICAHMTDPKASFGVCVIEEFLTSTNVDFIKEKKFEDLPNRYAFDFYLPSHNLIIEYHGPQHEKLAWGANLKEKSAALKAIKMRDKIKADFAKCSKIKLLVIWYREHQNEVDLKALIAKKLTVAIPSITLKIKKLSPSQLNKIWMNQISFEDCQLEAKKYQNRKAFKAGSYRFYNIARREGWLNDVCIHMKRPHSHNFKWDRKSTTQAANSCKSKAEFKKKFPGAYAAARKNEWYLDLCKHMVRPN